MSKTALGVFFGIIGALIFLHLYRQYRMAQDQGKPFDIWASLFSPVMPVETTLEAKYVYRSKKCYLKNGDKEVEVNLRNCYDLTELATDLVAEYTNLSNQISALPNPNDPNYAVTVANLSNRQNEIIAILKDVKGCNPRQGIDIPTLTCI